MLLVEILEDIATKVLDAPDKVPGLVVADALTNVAHDDGTQRDIIGNGVNKIVDGLLNDLLVVELDSEVGIELEFACQIAQN